MSSTFAFRAGSHIFLLKPADGATGAYVKLVGEVYEVFERLAREIAHRIHLTLPENTR